MAEILIDLSLENHYKDIDELYKKLNKRESESIRSLMDELRFCIL